MLAVSRTRVSDHSPDHVNEAILNEIEDNIDYYASAGRGNLNQRLKELDHGFGVILRIPLCLLRARQGELKRRKFYMMSVSKAFLL